MDPFAVLGVAPGSSERAIREAYLRRSKELHPDVGGTDAAMQELNAAYEAATSAPPAVDADPGPGPNWSQDQFAPPARLRTPRPPRRAFYKRPVFYIGAALLGLAVGFSGATDEPSPETRPAIFGLIGRCVNLVERDISEVVPCAGPHDAWVVDVVDRTEPCPPLATGYVVPDISHHVCITTQK